MDHYKTLKISSHATPGDIRKAYHKLAVRFHPDKHMDPVKKKWAEDSFKVINEAYSILKDPKKRNEYDTSFSYAHASTDTKEREKTRTNADVKREFWEKRKKERAEEEEKRKNEEAQKRAEESEKRSRELKEKLEKIRREREREQLKAEKQARENRKRAEKTNRINEEADKCFALGIEAYKSITKKSIRSYFNGTLQNNLFQAKEALYDCIKKYPESNHSEDSLYYLTNIYNEIKDYSDGFKKEALKVYELIFKKYPDTRYIGDIKMNLAKFYLFKINDTEKAIKIIDEIMDDNISDRIRERAKTMKEYAHSKLGVNAWK
ncbi:MAG: DnaJ domain-containing protein [Candidatus Omnitrophica bacterium]|nr:DnaJ domain-containing protein [Candidatus Omnitrophota bacterium]